MRGVCSYLTTVSPPPPSSTAMPYLTTEHFREHCAKIVDVVQEEFDSTLDVGDKEASGRVLLGLFMNVVRKALKLKYPKHTLCVDYEYRVLTDKQYAVDTTVVALTHIMRVTGSVRNVVLALEYKPKVAAELRDQIPWHVSEVLLQAFYMRKRFTHDILHCLTDLQDYHYFLVGTQPDSPFCIKGYWYKMCKITDPTELTDHLHFLCDAITLSY